MIFKIYNDDKVYQLDKERGKGKIYEIISKSTPKKVDKIFSKKPYAHVPSGTYEFYIQGYALCVCWILGAIYDLFNLLEQCINNRVNLLMTINYEGPCSYVVAMPVGEKDIRFVFLDRKDYKKRRYNLDADRDLELERTIPLVDIIIDRYELIKQFNKEFHKIYDKNKYYLTKEYEEECTKNGCSVCQEYVLRNGFEKYMPIFDSYLENPKKYFEGTFFDRDKCDFRTFKTTEELNNFFTILKKYNNMLTTFKLQKITIMGAIPKETDKNNKQNVSFALNEPISIFYDPQYSDEHIDIDFIQRGRFMMQFNQLSFWEKSNITKSLSWTNISRYFSKNIMNHNIVEVVSKSLNQDNYIDVVEFVMDNGYKLTLRADTAKGCMYLTEEEPDKIQSKE